MVSDLLIPLYEQNPLRALDEVLGLTLSEDKELQFIKLFCSKTVRDECCEITEDIIAIIIALRSSLFERRLSGVIFDTFAMSRFVMKEVAKLKVGEIEAMNSESLVVFKLSNGSTIGFFPPGFNPSDRSKRLRGYRFNDVYARSTKDMWPALGSLASAVNANHTCSVAGNHVVLLNEQS